MSRVKWIRGPVCGIDNCRSRLYMRNAGRKVCQFGHVAEGDLDIEEDEGEQYSQTKRLNIQLTDTGFGSQASSQTPTASVLSSKSSEKLHGQQSQLLVYQCLQLLLRKITPKVLQHLYKHMGEEVVESLQTSIDPVLKLLWIRCIRVSHVHSSPTIVDLYVLIYLALRQLNRYPVFIDQYLEMIAKNHVPYFNANTLIPREMTDKLPISNSWFFAARESLHDGTFYTYISKWLYHLNIWSMRFAPLDFSYSIVYKLLNDLRIPHAPQILTIYHKLAQVITNGHFEQKGEDSAVTVPEAQALGLAHYSIRLYLIASKEIMDKQAWTDWISQDAEIPCFGNRIQHMTTEQIMRLSDNQVSTYLDWVYENILHDNQKDPDSEDIPAMEKKLGKIFTYVKSNAEVGSTTTNTPVAVSENNLSPTQLADVENKLEDFLCSRFGMKSSMLLDLRARIEAKLVNKIAKLGLKLPEASGAGGC